VHSEPGSGTTFRIYFRPAARSTEAADAGERGGAWTTGSETVLIAEDEEQVRHVLERTLARAGYRVLAAGGGAEALAIAEQNDGSVALLLADVIMPVVSGQELVARLRERWPRMPVVFLSGYSDEAVTRHGVLAEDTVFLQKPVPPEQLLRTVRRVIDAADGRGGGDR
jgi:CheY-like chemotaxis protein